MTITVEEALQSENKSLKDVIKSINAEKIAIDQMYVQAMRNEVLFRTQAVILQDRIKELETDAKKPELEIVKEDAA